MRTTLTIEEDVAQQLRQRMAEKKLPLKRVVNDALRVGLATSGKKERTTRFVVKPHSFGFLPGIDHDKLGQLLDQLDTEDFIRKMSQ